MIVLRCAHCLRRLDAFATRCECPSGSSIRRFLLILARRYPAPILERVILAIGIAAMLAQTLLIVWALS